MAQRRGRRRVVVEFPVELYERVVRVIEGHMAKQGISNVSAYVVSSVAAKLAFDEEAWRVEYERTMAHKEAKK